MIVEEVRATHGLEMSSAGWIDATTMLLWCAAWLQRRDADWVHDGEFRKWRCGGAGLARPAVWIFDGDGHGKITASDMGSSGWVLHFFSLLICIFFFLSCSGSSTVWQLGLEMARV